MKVKMSETDLAKVVISHLEEQGWEIYQEVVCWGGVCDIVGKRGNILWAIECKVSFGLAVIEQAVNHKRQFHYSSVAVPSKRGGGFAERICRKYGVGVLKYKHSVTELIRPKLNRKIAPVILHEEQKTFCEAGSSNGGHWTDFRRTVRMLVQEVSRNPGMEFKEAIRAIDHHYSSFGSAKSCLLGFIGTVIPELRTEIIDRKLCVFLAKEGKEQNV